MFTQRPQNDLQATTPFPKEGVAERWIREVGSRKCVIGSGKSEVGTRTWEVGSLHWAFQLGSR